MGNYKYRLQYIADDYKVDIEFKADIDIYKLQEQLTYFLLACSWTPEQVKTLLGGIDE